ncbi:MAG: class I SAM-dependent methyltransferase [Pseudarthrobacter sp.]
MDPGDAEDLSREVAFQHLQHPGFARAYARAVRGMNRRGGTEHRRRLLAGLHGTVVEIGAGDGSAFALYPPTVTHVLALEPDDYLRCRALDRAVSAPIPVAVHPAAAEQIPVEDASIDAVVTSLVPCNGADQGTALAEIRRVLRPGGTLAFYEHVRSNRPLLAKAEDLLTPPWQLIAGGCHPGRVNPGLIEDWTLVGRDLDLLGDGADRKAVLRPCSGVAEN